MKQETIELVAAAGNKTTIAGAGMTGIGFFMSNEFFGLVGAIVVVAGWLVNWYYKRKADKRQEAEDARRQHESDLRSQEIELRMRLMRYAGKPVDGDIAGQIEGGSNV